MSYYTYLKGYGVLLALVLLAPISDATISDADTATPPDADVADVVELFLLPHTHADVGWLQTVDSLSRTNVSRILNGVTGNLANDTLKRRRFVWDEMAFLQLWWDGQATDEQKAAFTMLVKEGRIEFVDNGWSQHDMGCTTLDSMLSNWEIGHLWLREHFGEEAQPKIGWSLDPFGMSSSQAVMQALMGMEAWFFTRVTGDIVDQMKANKSVEFVWRASSALSDQQSEIFAHVLESYYCMPLPTYAFEWGAAKGAKVPTKENVVELAWSLANISKQRARWFRTPNVLIPWGCDYQYQNAALVYESTDWLIDTINAHPQWGVHVQYTTPSEYLAALKTSALKSGTKFPVKQNGTSFFPFNDWSGYYTSRPSLKGNSQKAVSQLLAAEALFALRVKPGTADAAGLWALLQTARKNNGIVQHHDAITGTGCDNQEGCSGTDQITGAHNIIGDYQRMLSDSMTATATVAATVLGAAAGVTNLTLDAGDLGKVLEGGGDGGDDAIAVVYNPLGTVRTEAVTIPVPVCSVAVYDAMTNATVLSQVTASIGIGDGQAPFYDFELQFIAAAIPALGFRQYRISPMPDGQCHGGDVASGSKIAREMSAFSRHEMRHPVMPDGIARSPARQAAIFDESIRRQGECSGDLLGWQATLRQVEIDMAPAHVATTNLVVMENKFMKVVVDLTRGIKSVYDKAAGHSIAVDHDLMLYTTTSNDAYGFAPKGPAVPVLSSPGGPALGCVGWRQTAHCDPTGTHQPAHDQQCTASIQGKQSGWCECVGGSKRSAVGCDLARANFTCEAVCSAAGPQPVPTVGATVALGPVLQEVRLQIAGEHKTRIRIWVTDDPELGARIEFAHRIGTLEENTELSSRFTLGGDAGKDPLVMYSEDNGYEVIPHAAGTGAAGIATHLYPSQMSAFVGNSTVQMSVALDRSHAVGSLYNGTLEVVQHRRGGPFLAGHGTVVLDDTDRIFTQTWLNVGAKTKANRARLDMRQRLNHPLVLAYAHASASSGAAPIGAAGIVGLPSSIHLQSVRSTNPTNSEFLLRLQHLFTEGEDGERAQPETVDVTRLVSGLRHTVAADEVTLDGMRSVNTTATRQRFPATVADRGLPTVDTPVSADGDVTVNPFELRTFRIT